MSRVESDYKFVVIRGSKQNEVPIFDLVVGDIVEIKYGIVFYFQECRSCNLFIAYLGNTLPVDGILLRSSELQIDESSLTGESDMIKKNTEDDVVLLSGTHVMQGVSCLKSLVAVSTHLPTHLTSMFRTARCLSRQSASILKLELRAYLPYR